jgi:ferredoxin
MAHLAARSGYQSLVERINRFPQGAPPSRLLDRILSLLLDEREAGLVAQLPIAPFTAGTAARRWGTSEAGALAVLEPLAARGFLLDLERGGRRTFVLPPPMAGFFEFSMMRVRSDVDQKALAELFHEYLNVEEDFVKALFTGGETGIGRVFVNERVLSGEESLRVLDHELSSEVVESASAIGLGLCYCRHKMEHVGKACAAPLDVCLTFNGAAESLTRHGIARRIDRAEARDVLDRSRALGLVQFGDNVREKVGFVCNCCGCCCEAMLAVRRFGLLTAVHTTRFLAEAVPSGCDGCGRCVDACPVEAVALVSACDPKRPRRRVARVDADRCLGCGVCLPACPKPGRAALRLSERGERILTPLNTVHRAVLMAVERGGLQDLIFDNRALASHRAMAAILGAVLRLPPVKRAMASEQMRSVYLERLIRWWDRREKGTAPDERAGA